jgi:hypothetical protein
VSVTAGSSGKSFSLISQVCPTAPPKASFPYDFMAECARLIAQRGTTNIH